VPRGLLPASSISLEAAKGAKSCTYEPHRGIVREEHGREQDVPLHRLVDREEELHAPPDPLAEHRAGDLKPDYPEHDLLSIKVGGASRTSPTAHGPATPAHTLGTSEKTH